MSFLSFWTKQLGIEPETKSEPGVTVFDIPQRSVADIQADVRSGEGAPSPILISSVFACARVIAEGLAQVPCLLQRTSATGGHELAFDHPLYNLLSRAPNDFQTSFEFREWVGFQLALTGNAFVFVSRDTNKRPIELIPLPAGSVAVSKPNIGEVRYRLNVVGNPIYDQTNIWHIKGPSWLDHSGMSIQNIAARAIGLATDLETFGSQLFKNGSRPSGLLTTDEKLSAEQHQQLAQAWNDQQSGVSNALKTAILSSGLKFQTLQTTANEAQFIEARRYQTEEICRIMRVDPIMIAQATDSASYASIEQRFLAHLTHTIAPWHQRFEQSAERALLSEGEVKKGYRVHLDSRGLMRGNAVDRANYFSLMAQNGFMTKNEVREAEGLDRDPDPASDKLTPAANLYGPTTPAEPK